MHKPPHYPILVFEIDHKYPLNKGLVLDFFVFLYKAACLVLIYLFNDSWVLATKSYSPHTNSRAGFFFSLSDFLTLTLKRFSSDFEFSPWRIIFSYIYLVDAPRTFISALISSKDFFNDFSWYIWAISISMVFCRSSTSIFSFFISS